MPSFAELRAKAEAAANSAKVTANSKLAAYRGDEQPAKPVYKPPPPRPVVKPDVPLATRPRTPGVPEDEEDEAGTKTEAIDSTTTLMDDKADLSPEIQTLIKNKLLFFEFLDEVCTYMCLAPLGSCTDTMPVLCQQWISDTGRRRFGYF